MRSSQSFVDLLFILLCATIVLLSQSLQIGAVDAAPAKVGSGGVSDIFARDVRSVVVRKDHLLLDGTEYGSADRIVPELEAHVCVVLVTGDVNITHHRMMYVWSNFRELGYIAKLGVKPTDDTNASQKRGAN